MKFYMFTYEPAEQIANLDDTRADCAERLKRMAADLSPFAAGEIVADREKPPRNSRISHPIG